MKYLLIFYMLTACASPVDVPEEARDADGVGGATGKVAAAKWLGQVILQLVTNTNFEVKIEKSEKEPCPKDP